MSQVSTGTDSSGVFKFFDLVQIAYGKEDGTEDKRGEGDEMLKTTILGTAE